MALNSYAGYLACPGTGGTQDITAPGFEPDIVFFWANVRTADGYSGTSGQLTTLPNSFGIACNDAATPNQGCYFNSDDFTGGDPGLNDADVIYLRSEGDSTNRAVASLNAWLSNGFQLDWSWASAGNGAIINYLALGGSDITGVNYTQPAFQTGTGLKTYSGAGFAPDAAIILIGDYYTYSSHTSGGIGFVSGVGEESSLSVSYWTGDSNAGTYQRNDKAIVANKGAVKLFEANLDSFTSDGLVLNVTTNVASWVSGVNPEFHIIYLKGLNVKVGHFNEETATGSKPYTGVGFTPVGMLFASGGRPTMTTIQTGAMRETIGGVDDALTQAVTDYLSGNNAVTGLNRTKVLSHGSDSATPSVLAAASITALGSDGFTLNYSSADATARETFYMAFGAAGVVPQEYTDTGTVSLKFTPSASEVPPPAPQALRPISDIDAGGWEVTPLWSKVDEDTPDNTTITASVGVQAVFPLKVSADGRYLTYQDDSPFLIRGDSSQAAFVCLTLAEVEDYLDDRVTNGFNALWINILTGVNVYGYNGGLTYDGIAPFTSGSGPSTYDASTPNSTYWSRMDSMIDAVAVRNMLLLLNPAEWIDWNGFYWNNGETAIQDYGEWIATRYASYDNIIWWLGNDFQTWNDADHVDANLMGAMAAGIRTGAPNHLISILLDYETSWSSQFDHWHSPVTGPELNGVYAYNNIGWSCFEGRASVDADPIPTFLAETNYEYENNTNEDAYSNHRQRVQQWSAMASGMCGHMYGNAYTAHYIRDWGTYPDECHTEALTQFMAMNDYMETKAWYDLAPDATHTVLTAGYGTYEENIGVEVGDFRPCAITADGTFAIIYSPKTLIQALTVDMTEFSGTVTATWVDPADLTTSEDSASPLANTGSHNFTTPAVDNSDTAEDWVLVLEVL